MHRIWLIYTCLSTHSELEVIYGGTGLYDYQVDSAIIHDYLLAIASFVLIVIVVFVLSGFSVWLTVLGIYSVFSCFPWAYFVYRMILGKNISCIPLYKDR